MLRDDDYYEIMKDSYNIPESFEIIEIINLNDYNDRDMALTFIVALYENHENPDKVSSIVRCHHDQNDDIIFMKNTPDEVLYDYGKDKVINSVFTCNDSIDWRTKYLPYACQVIFIGTESA